MISLYLIFVVLLNSCVENNNKSNIQQQSVAKAEPNTVKADSVEIWNLIERVGFKGDTSINYKEIIYLDKHRNYFAVIRNGIVENYDSLKIKNPSTAKCYYAMHKYQMLCGTAKGQNMEYYVSGMDGEVRTYTYSRDTLISAASIRKDNK